MGFDNRTKRLIAVGASVTANCQPCLRYHSEKALKDGANTEEITEAIRIAQQVRQGAASKMDQFTRKLDYATQTSDDTQSGGCGCAG
jgi:AhpD family alkylhydroperoxidase